MSHRTGILARKALAVAAGSYTVCPHDPGVVKGASTDLGEVSHLKPVYQFNTGGYTGNLHQKDNHPEDEYLAYVVTAKVFAFPCTPPSPARSSPSSPAPM